MIPISERPQITSVKRDKNNNYHVCFKFEETPASEINFKVLGGKIANLSAKMGYSELKKEELATTFKPLGQALCLMATLIHNNNVKGKTTPYFLDFTDGN